MRDLEIYKDHTDKYKNGQSVFANDFYQNPMELVEDSRPRPLVSNGGCVPVVGAAVPAILKRVEPVQEAPIPPSLAPLVSPTNAADEIIIPPVFSPIS